MEGIHDSDDIKSAYHEGIEMEERQNVLNHNKRSKIGNILELSPPLEESRTVLEHDRHYLFETSDDHLSSKSFQTDMEPRQFEQKYQNWCPDSYQPFGLNHRETIDPRQQMSRGITWSVTSLRAYVLELTKVKFKSTNSVSPSKPLVEVKLPSDSLIRSVVKQLTEQGHWIAAVQESISALAKCYDKISVLEAKMNKLQEERSRIYHEKRHTKYDS